MDAGGANEPAGRLAHERHEDEEGAQAIDGALTGTTSAPSTLELVKSQNDY